MRSSMYSANATTGAFDNVNTKYDDKVLAAAAQL